MVGDGRYLDPDRHRRRQSRRCLRDLGRSSISHGTLALQFPIFRRLGVDLRGLHSGTINVLLDGPLDLGPATHVFRQVEWHNSVPPEDFSLWSVQFEHRSWRGTALLYRPHPETKPDHHQPSDVIEIVAPPVAGLDYGDRVRIWMTPPAPR